MYCYLSAVTNEEIDQLLSNPTSIEEFIDEEHELEDYLDLEKSWDGVHFLLKGTKESQQNKSLFFLYEGGEPVGDIDVGYGPARVMKSDFVNRLKVGLDSVTEDELKANYEPKKMEEVYPSIWDRESENNRAWLLMNINELRKFLSKATEHNLGMLVWLQ